MTLPPGYEARGADGVLGFAWSEAVDWLGSVLESGHTLADWAAHREGVKPLVGRGSHHAVPAAAPGPDDRPRWAVRHYVRGGAVYPLLDDRYVRWGRSRPIGELRATVEARARGVPAPAVVAGAVYPSGPFYRADLVTELVPDARTLGALLFTGYGSVDRPLLLELAGRLVRTMEDTRVTHADLNAANVLVVRGCEGPVAHVVDLDRCRIRPMNAPPSRGRMRGRLERSLRKLGAGHERALSGEEWAALRRGYGG